jgi:hypothetical protein
LGLPPSPVTSEILDQAVAIGLREAEDLDWKQKLPEQRVLKDTDFAKDVAAMANSGGGVIVYGIAEDPDTSAATRRLDVGEVTDGYERTIRQVASGVQPPIFGLNIARLGEVGNRVLVITVPASPDSPHLIYNKEFFGAPMRDGARTHWMRERQLEQSYRLRHERRRRAEKELTKVYAHAAAHAKPDKRMWLVGVARPAIEYPPVAISREEARVRLTTARRHALEHVRGDGIHPLNCGDVFNPRVGLRRWNVAINVGYGRADGFREAWAALHRDGTVTLTAAMGGGPGDTSGTRLEAGEVDSRRVEAFIADLFGLLRCSAERHAGEFELCIGVEPTHEGTTRFLPWRWSGGFDRSDAREIHHFIPVEATVSTEVSLEALHDQVKEVALDVLNQAAIQDLLLIRESL